MKKIILTAAVAFFAFSVQANNINLVDMTVSQNSIINTINPSDDNTLSTMTLKVKKVVKSDAKAEEIKTELMKINGIKDVSACTQSGTVTVKYSKSELGCCSKIHTALKESKWKYDLVSNEEKPACSKGGAKKCCPSQKQKGA